MGIFIQDLEIVETEYSELNSFKNITNENSAHFEWIRLKPFSFKVRFLLLALLFFMYLMYNMKGRNC